MTVRKKTDAATAGQDSGSTKPADPVDDLVATKHQLEVGRRTLDYTATTGRIVLRDEVYEDGTFQGFKAKAEVSITSYTVDTPDGSTSRPVTFAFNGGPGSSSVWLHLGLFGPRRIVMGDVGNLLPPPYGLADNAESLLAVSDLVFIDPVSTGYSRTVEAQAEPFHGYQGDIESVGEIIHIWTSRHKRWMSPKFVAGESYGTLRGAALVEHLQSRHGMYVNGLILISSVLDVSSIDFENQRNDRAHALYLPTYAAIAHYHGKLGQVAQERAGRGRGVRRPGVPVGALAWGPADPQGARRRGEADRRADRSHRGLRRPGRPAHRALAVLRRAAPRRAAHRRPARRPLLRTGEERDRRGDGRRPLARRDRGSLRRGVQPLRPRRARLRERPALRADLPPRCTRGPTRTSRAARST